MTADTEVIFDLLGTISGEHHGYGAGYVPIGLQGSAAGAKRVPGSAGLDLALAGSIYHMLFDWTHANVSGLLDDPILSGIATREEFSGSQTDGILSGTASSEMPSGIVLSTEET
jgi:hypothetical protein